MHEIKMEGPTTSASFALIQAFEREVRSRLTKQGVWPLPMAVLDQRGIAIAEVKCSDRKAYEVFTDTTRHLTVEAAIIGFDRLCSIEECETEFKDVLTCILYERPSLAVVEMPWNRNQFSCGIIEYQHKPRCIRPIRWNNRWWTNQLRLELYAFVPDIAMLFNASNRIQ